MEQHNISFDLLHFIIFTPLVFALRSIVLCLWGSQDRVARLNKENGKAGAAFGINWMSDRYGHEQHKKGLSSFAHQGSSSAYPLVLIWYINNKWETS